MIQAAASVALAFAVHLAVHSAPALAEGPNAIAKPPGYDANLIARGDDTSVQVVNLPFTMNWFGTTYDRIYINNNGNCTFGQQFNTYTPTQTLVQTNQNIMAPFWADVDTRAGAQMTYSNIVTPPSFNGRPAMFVNWIDVGFYNRQTNPVNSFQLILVDRSDTGAGNFDFVFNYDKVLWDRGQVSGNQRARAGWARAAGSADYYEMPGSGSTTADPLLDGAPASTSLIQNYRNDTGQLGRYMWEVRNGGAPNIPPTIQVVDRVLEGNVPGGYLGYVGIGDATATDADGTVASLTHDRPAILPLGTTDVTWTAVDNDGAVTRVVQHIQVVDTTPPTNPTLTSPTHATGVWTRDATVTVDSTGAIDACSGASGLSYVWSQDSTAAPDAVSDPSVATTVTTDATVTVDSESFATAAWPAAWTPSSTWVALTNAAGRNHGTYAAEVWANSNTRRTADLYRDYNLAGFDSATLSFWDSVGPLSGGPDYARVEYSTDGGTNWMVLQNRTSASAWAQQTYSLPVGGAVRVRFSASVNRATEYADWDDIEVLGLSTADTPMLSSSTTSALADGTWYFNIRSVDATGNWSPTTSMGPFLIDTTAPVTSDDAPAGWSMTPLSVTLSATDAGVIAFTRYVLNGGPVTDYAAPIPVAVEGTSTLSYWSADAAGNSETTHTTMVRIDTGPPSIPASVTASAISTSAIALAWQKSTDAVSGVASYEVFRDGASIGTTTGVSYVSSGLTAGQTYSFEVRAMDLAGNFSARSAPTSETVPIGELWLGVSDDEVSYGAINPGGMLTLIDAVVVSVGGVGSLDYDLLCEAIDFYSTEPSSTATLPAGTMTFETRGWVSLPPQPFLTSPLVLDTSSGSGPPWRHDYIMDYTLSPPWDTEPGEYETVVTYTVVEK